MAIQDPHIFVPNLRCTEKKICSAPRSPTPFQALLSTDQVAAISGCCELLATWENIGMVDRHNLNLQHAEQRFAFAAANGNALQRCSCGKGKEPKHFFFCRTARRRHGRPSGPAGLTSPEYYLGDPKGAAHFDAWLKKTRFYKTSAPTGPETRRARKQRPTQRQRLKPAWRTPS